MLVHGTFVDGSACAGVHRILRQDGHKVVAEQNPATASLADEVAAKRLRV